MHPYHNYLVKSTDEFDPKHFLPVDEEVVKIKMQIDHLPSLFKPEIVVSFLKDHSLQNDWIKVNPELTEVVTSGSLFTGSIESLFESSRNNPVFRRDLEIYLTNRFSKTGSPSETLVL